MMYDKIYRLKGICYQECYQKLLKLLITIHKIYCIYQKIDINIMLKQILEW